MEKLCSLFAYLIINILCFYVFPLFIVDTSSAILILMCIIPVACLLTSIFYGARHSFYICYPLLTALSFIPSVWIFYNDSAWAYVPSYGAIALIGNLLGMIIYKNKSTNKMMLNQTEINN